MSMASYAVSGDLKTGYYAGDGELRKYSTFRYHPGGNAGLTYSRMRFHHALNGPSFDVYDMGFRAGLRNSAGTQVTSSAVWGKGQFGRKNWVGVPAGNLAINARAVKYVQGTYAAFWWNGTLHLDGGGPV